MGKHIAAVISHYIGGGAERVTDIIASGLIARNHQVTLITAELPGFLKSHAESIYSAVKIIPDLGRYKSSVTQSIATELSAIGANALILLVDDYPGISLLRNAMPDGSKIIYHPHNSPFYQVRAKVSHSYPDSGAHMAHFRHFLLKVLPERIMHRYSRRYKRRALNTAKDVDSYLMLCEGDTAQMRKAFPQYAGKFVTMPNPLTCARPHQLPEKRNEILYLGRLDPIQKRVDRLLHIFALTRNEFPDWTLKIVGNGPDENRLKTLATELSIDDAVEFCGFSDDPSAHLSTASVLCLTSEYEGYGLVLVEAMAYGCVPMAYDCDNGVRFLLGENRGILIEPNHPEEYARQLSILMGSEDARHRICKCHEPFLKSLENDAITDRWERLLNTK